MRILTRNKSGKEDNLLGVSTQKHFIESIANTVGTDFKGYKIVKRDQFVYVAAFERDDIKAELKVDLIILLDENGYPPYAQDEVYKEVFDQGQNFKKYQG